MLRLFHILVQKKKTKLDYYDGDEETKMNEIFSRMDVIKKSDSM